MVCTITNLDYAEKVGIESLASDFLAKSATYTLLIMGVCMHIQSRADNGNGNGMMAMVMMAMMIVLVMVKHSTRRT